MRPRRLPSSHGWRNWVMIAALAVMCLTWLPGRVGAQPARLRSLVGTTFSAEVDSVVDGDTIHVRDATGRDIVVRLQGIDTPERGEPFSVEARNAARVLLFSRLTEIRATDVDRYGRLVARAYVDGVDTSLELVRMGLACHFKRYSSELVLAQGQQEAMKAGVGFWAPGAPKPACVTAEQPSKGVDINSGPFHGNTMSRVFHAPDCPQYRCLNCTVVFETREEASAAGFKPAGDCLR